MTPPTTNTRATGRHRVPGRTARDLLGEPSAVGRRPVTAVPPGKLAPPRFASVFLDHAPRPAAKEAPRPPEVAVPRTVTASVLRGDEIAHEATLLERLARTPNLLGAVTSTAARTPGLAFADRMEDVFDQLWVRVQRRLTAGDGNDEEVEEEGFDIRHGSIQSLVIASWNNDEGASTVALGLAARAAGSVQGEVCLVDADLQQRELTESAGMADRPGLQELLSGSASLDDVIVGVPDSRMSFLPAGKRGGEDAAADGSIQRVIMQLEDRFRYVFYDTPCLKHGIEAYRWGRFVINAVLVVLAGHARRQTVEHSIAAMRLQGMDVLGTILNRRVDPIPSWLYPYL